VNPAFLPQLGASLRKLGAYPDQHDVTDAILADLAAELDRARGLLAAARGLTPCPRHPGGPTDPADGGACLLCRTPRQPDPSVPAPAARSPAEVLAAIAEHGPEAATRLYGGHAVTRALALGHTRQNKPNTTTEPEDNP
jgi:hypothetical protein